jgi:hypothetical protein
VSTSGDAITGAANDLGSGLTGLAQLGAGAVLLLAGFLLMTGLSKPLTRTAARVAKTAIPVAKVVR